MLIAVIVLGLICLGLLAFVIVSQRTGQRGNGEANLMLKQDITTLTDTVTQLKEGLHTQINARLDKSNVQMLKQFEQSANIIKDVTAKLTSLEKTNQQVGDIAGEL